MMVKMKQRVWGMMMLGAALLMGACVPEPIPLQVDQPDPKLVLASRITPSGRIYVMASRTFTSLKMDDGGENLANDLLEEVMVNSGKVTLTCGGVTEVLTPVATGVYRSEKNPLQIGKEYVVVVHDYLTGEMVSAAEPMLRSVRFEKIKPKLMEKDNVIDAEFSYSFMDPPGESNWYMINVYSKREREDDDEFALDGDLSQGSQVLKHAILLRDTGRDGEEISGEFVVPAVLASDSLTVSMANISPGYYEYLELRQKADNYLTTLLAEPVNYPSNVENGYGFFTTHSGDSWFFDLNSYEVN